MGSQPVEIGLGGAKEKSCKAKAIDAEPSAMLLHPPNGQEPAVIEENVVGVLGIFRPIRITQIQKKSVFAIQGKQILPLPGIPSGTQGIAPRPWLVQILELVLEQGSQRATGFPLLSGQELEVTVWLAGSRRRAAVEKPQPAGVSGHMGHGLPVGLPEPSGLGLPLLGDQQQMGRLNRVLVKNQHMAVAKPHNLQGLVPRKKGVGLRTLVREMAGGRSF
jgi:hypothetical protein